MALVGSRTLSLVPITVPGSIGQRVLCVPSLGLRWAPHAKSFPSRKYLCPDDSWNISGNFSHKTRLPAVRTLTTPHCKHALILRRSYLAHSHSTIFTSLLVENAVGALIDFPDARTFVEHQIKDSHEHTHTCHFCCHSRSIVQMNRNSTDHHPSVPSRPLSSPRRIHFYRCLWNCHPNNLSLLSTLQDCCICQ